jgi:hypothetical protein
MEPTTHKALQTHTRLYTQGFNTDAFTSYFTFDNTHSKNFDYTYMVRG